MPSGSALGFATLRFIAEEPRSSSFYALGFGLGFATKKAPKKSHTVPDCFYALGFGLGFATCLAIIG